MKAILELLIPVLIHVESGGDVNAIGDMGEAVGCLQIHEIMVDDVNRIAGKFGYICHDTEDIQNTNPLKCVSIILIIITINMSNGITSEP